MYQAKLHWIVFSTPLLLLLLGLLLLGGGEESSGAAGLFIVLAIAIGLGAAINYATSEFAVTDKRVLVKVGVLRRRSLELNLAKVESVEVNQGILGRILDYGTMVVRGTGGTRELFKNISDPMAFRMHVQNQGATAQSRSQP